MTKEILLFCYYMINLSETIGKADAHRQSEAIECQCCQVLSLLVRDFNKKTMLFGKNTPLIHIFFNSATFPLFHAIFPILNAKLNIQFCSNFNSFITFAGPNIIGKNFRYFSATFG
jgi:hypothetical protein